MKLVSKNDIEIIYMLVTTNLKIKYKRTSLGFIWSFLNPLLSVFVISVIFSVITNTNYKEYLIMLFPCFIAWNFFSASVAGSSGTIIGSEGIIKKSPINLLIFPLVNILTTLVEFLAVFSLFFVMAMFFGYSFSTTIFIIPFSLLLLIIFSIGLGLIVSVISTYLRDIGYLLTVFMQLWFYVTPVLYKKELIVGKLPIAETIININPMTYILEMIRAPISYNSFPTVSNITISVVVSIFSLVLGVFVFNKYKDKLVYRL